MNALSFAFSPSPETNSHEVRALVDGYDLLAVDEDLMGLDPPQFFRQRELLTGGSMTIARCVCGDAGCGGRSVEVIVSHDAISWREGQAQLGRFERGEYEATVKRASRDTSWESTERTAERFVESIDQLKTSLPDWVFRFASARIKRGVINLAFERDGQQLLIEVAWNEREPEDARQQVLKWIEARSHRDVGA